MLAGAEFGGAAAELAGEDAAEVVAIGEAAVDGDLINAFIAQGERLRRAANAGGEDVGGRGGSCVAAKGANEFFDTHAGAAGEDRIGQFRLGRAMDEGENLLETLRKCGRGGNFDGCEGCMKQGGAVMVKTVFAPLRRRFAVSGDEGVEQGFEQGIDSDDLGLPQRVADGVGEGEVDPEVTGGKGAAAVEDGIGGDEEGGAGFKGDGLIPMTDVATGLGVVVEAPEGAVHAFVVPVFQGGLVAAFVQKEGGTAGLSGAGEAHAEGGGVIEVIAPGLHGGTRIRHRGKR